MEPLRILVAGMPQLIGDMVADALRGQPDMAVVRGDESLRGLRGLASRTEPNVVVVGVESAELPAEAGALLLERPALKVLGLEMAGGHGHLWEMRPQRVPIGSLTPADLAWAIRRAVNRRLHAVKADP